jgi:ribosome-associated translation inhibitor RaiA
MALNSRVETRGFVMNEREQRAVARHLASLADRLVHRPEPKVVLVLEKEADQRRATADLRLQLGPLGAHLVSHNDGPTPVAALKRALDDVGRQLERLTARQRGEPAFGVASRRYGWRRRPAADEAAEAGAADEVKPS